MEIDLQEIEYLNLRQLRGKVDDLVAERKRKNELTSRLEAKVENLRKELAEKRETTEQLARRVKFEKRKLATEHLAKVKEEETKVADVDGRIKSMLMELMYEDGAGTTSSVGLGGALVDSSGTGTAAPLPLRSLMVSYFKPGTSVRCDLRFRVGASSRIDRARLDACHYWKVGR